MALSKWFLCGAEGCFSANEDLAFTFADKAARKGLATAEFALGYYLELGIGCRKDIEAAKKWYSKASLSQLSESLFSIVYDRLSLRATRTLEDVLIL